MEWQVCSCGGCKQNAEVAKLKRFQMIESVTCLISICTLVIVLDLLACAFLQMVPRRFYPIT